MSFGRLSRFGGGFWETVRNIGWLGLEKVMRIGGSLVVGVMVVRYLGPVRFGSYSYAYAIYGIFNVISTLGLDYLVVSDLALAKEAEREEEVLGSAFLLKCGASVLTTLAAIGYAWFTNPGDTVVVLIVAMLSVAAISQGFDVVDYFFQSRTRSRVTVMAQLVVFVVSNLARVAAVLLRCQLLIFGLIAALEILATQLGFAVVYWHHQRNLFRWKFRRERAVRLLKAGWPLLIAGLMVSVYMRTDQILLGTMSTIAVVGQYSAAVKLSEIWYALPVIVAASVMPRLLKYKEEMPALYYGRLGKLYGLMAGTSTVLALLVTFFGRYAILLLFGTKYLPAAHILSLLIWAGPFVFLGCISNTQLIHENWTQFVLWRSIAGAIVNVGLNLLLIPRYGAVGSAFATLVAQCTTAYLMDLSSRKTWFIFRMKTAALTGFWMFQRPIYDGGVSSSDE
jgi:PST family polysaccharide transporter